ncbi:MAG: hypothetical protein HIU82_13905 [Proteobacteria bacterium]|nr:hypothetical protein [Pseudomonadota bacterium]
MEYGRATPVQVRREVRAEDLRANAALRLIQANGRRRADAAQRSLNAQAEALRHRMDAEAAWERRRNAARASVPAPTVSAAAACPGLPWWAGPLRIVECVEPTPWYVGIQKPFDLHLQKNAVSPGAARLAEARFEERRAWRAEGRGAMAVIFAAARVAEADAHDAAFFHDPEAAETTAAARSAHAAAFALLHAAQQPGPHL